MAMVEDKGPDLEAVAFLREWIREWGRDAIKGWGRTPTLVRQNLGPMMTRSKSEWIAALAEIDRQEAATRRIQKMIDDHAPVTSSLPARSITVRCRHCGRPDDDGMACARNPDMTKPGYRPHSFIAVETRASVALDFKYEARFVPASVHIPAGPAEIREAMKAMGGGILGALGVPPALLEPPRDSADAMRYALRPGLGIDSAQAVPKVRNVDPKPCAHVERLTSPESAVSVCVSCRAEFPKPVPAAEVFDAAPPVPCRALVGLGACECPCLRCRDFREKHEAQALSDSAFRRESADVGHRPPRPPPLDPSIRRHASRHPYIRMVGPAGRGCWEPR